MAQQTKLESIVQKMQEENSSDDEISAVIQEYKKQNPDEVNSILSREDEEYGPPISAAPPEQPPPYTGPTDFWGGVKESLFSGDAMRASDQSAKGWMQGAVLDLPHGLWEGAKMMATTNPIGALAYGLAGKEMPVNEAAGGLKQLPGALWEAGKMSGSQPYEFGRMLGNVTGQPAMTEGLFGNVPGLPSGLDIVKGTGRGIETTGRVMQNYSPFSEAITRGLVGTAGGSAFGPYGTAGALFVRPPKFLKGIESAAGRGVERGGQWMRNIDGSVDAAALEDFYGRNSPEAQNAIIRLSSTREGGASDPIMESPINPPDSEVPELRQFRESTNRNVWDPEETVVNENPPDPLAGAPFNAPDTEVLQPYRNWANGPEYVPPPVTINETTPSAFDRYGLMDKDVPEPAGIRPGGGEHPDMPAPPVAERPVGTGSAFERAMQAKAAAERAAGRDPSIGIEAPPVDVAGNPVLSMEKPVNLPKVAKGQKISVNPDGDIQWPGVPSAKIIRDIEVQGYKYEPETNVFRKQGLWSRFLEGESGEFTPGEMLDNLRKLFKREPTAVELEDAIRRQHKPGEPSGKVAPFLSAEERVQRQADLANVPQELPAFLKEDPQYAPQSQHGLGDAWNEFPTADENNLPPIVSFPNKGTPGSEGINYEFAGGQPQGPRGPSDFTVPSDRPQLPEPSGDINQIRQQNVMNPREMDPRMAARVEAGGPREFDFTKPQDVDPSQAIDDQIVEFLKSEDAHPPEATDLNAWKKLKDLGKKFLGDESGEFDPNTLWWNLRRYFGRVPTEAELTRGMQIDPEFKVGARAEEIKNEIANKPWSDVLNEQMTGKSSVMNELRNRLEQDVKKPFTPNLRDLGEVGDDLWNQLEHENKYQNRNQIQNTSKLVKEMVKFINDATDIDLAKVNRDTLGAMEGNAVTKSQKEAFGKLYELADAHYRKLRNPGLESPRSNQAKPIEDAFGPKPEIPPIDKWDTGPIKPRDDLNEKLYGSDKPYPDSAPAAPGEKWDPNEVVKTPSGTWIRGPKGEHVFKPYGPDNPRNPPDPNIKTPSLDNEMAREIIKDISKETDFDRAAHAAKYWEMRFHQDPSVESIFETAVNRLEQIKKFGEEQFDKFGREVGDVPDVPDTPKPPKGKKWSDELKRFIDDESGEYDPGIIELIKWLNKDKKKSEWNDRPPRKPLHGDEAFPKMTFQPDEGVASTSEFSETFLPRSQGGRIEEFDIQNQSSREGINQETEIAPEGRLQEIKDHYPSILEEATSIYRETNPKKIVENFVKFNTEHDEVWGRMARAQDARLKNDTPIPPELTHAFNRSSRLRNLAEAKYERAGRRLVHGDIEGSDQPPPKKGGSK